VSGDKYCIALAACMSDLQKFSHSPHFPYSPQSPNVPPSSLFLPFWSVSVFPYFLHAATPRSVSPYFCTPRRHATPRRAARNGGGGARAGQKKAAERNDSKNVNLSPYLFRPVFENTPAHTTVCANARRGDTQRLKTQSAHTPH
jgi:hypothetical protein